MSIYAILDTQTNQFVSYNSKCAWSKAGNAKNAFAMHSGSRYAPHGARPYFDEQDRYVIVELSEYYFMYKQLEK